MSRTEDIIRQYTGLWSDPSLQSYLNAHVKTVDTELSPILAEDPATVFDSSKVPFKRRHPVLAIELTEMDIGDILGEGDFLVGLSGRVINMPTAYRYYKIPDGVSFSYIASSPDGANALASSSFFSKNGILAVLDALPAAYTYTIEWDGATGRRVYAAFALDAEVDTDVVQKSFGWLAEVQGPSSEAYRDICASAVGLRRSGFTALHVLRILRAMTATDFCEEAGEVVALFEEGDVKIVQVGQRLYRAPKFAEFTVSLGDLVEEGALLFDTFDIGPLSHFGFQQSFPGLTVEGDMLETGQPVFMTNRDLPVSKNGSGYVFFLGGGPGEAPFLANMDVPTFEEQLRSRRGLLKSINPFTDILVETAGAAALCIVVRALSLPADVCDAAWQALRKAAQSNGLLFQLYMPRPIETDDTGSSSGSAVILDIAPVTTITVWAGYSTTAIVNE